MVGSSKILTVSYGTFSCTLEGFDDSFSTMKAIAEYFRDLAADDRYFGAEPPTPDAEMLARIAEREIARRVEARTEGTGIVLKAGQALSAPEEQTAPEPEAPEAESQPAPVQVDPEAATAEADEAAPDQIAEEDAPVVAPAPEVDAIADETDEEEVVAEVGDEPAEMSAPENEDQPASGDIPSEPERIAASHDDEAEGTDETDETDPWDYEAAASKLAESLAARPTPHRVAPTRIMPPHQEPPAAEAPAEELVELPPVLTAPPPHPDADSVAAKLERIRAVVGKSATRDEDTEDEIAAAPLSSAPAPKSVDVTPPSAEASPSGDAPPDQPSSPVEAAEPVAGANVPGKDGGKAPRPVRTRVIKMSLADFQRSLGRGEIEPASDDGTADMSEQESDPAEATAEARDTDLVSGTEPATEDYDDLSENDYDDVSDEDIAELAALDGTRPETGPDAATLSDEEEAELLAELAELERGDDIEAGAELPAEGPMVLSDADDAMETVESDDDWAEVAADDDDRDDLPAMPLADAPLRAEEEVDIADSDEDETADTGASWDAAVDENEDDDGLNLFGGEDDDEEDISDRAILSDDEDEDEDQDDLAAADPRALRRQRAFETNPDEDNEVLTRLIEHTDDQLNDPDTNRRRESITQLKAAVAAKEAARQMGEQDRISDETADEFRNDLRQAVRPRRPARVSERPTTRTERPQTAPLKLVASQRVDLDPSEAVSDRRPAAPVRPRRVRLDEASEAEAARDAGSFEVFARDMGAQGLAELLEAAAAYTAYVEGSEDFSRPQLMSKVRGLADRDFSREEGLRSFGTLLREGRIMKVRNGRFQVSEETKFHPERRAG